MKTTKTPTADLVLKRQGVLTLNEATATAAFALQEMAAGNTLDVQMHASDVETVFVFMANGLCATLHIQALNPSPVMKGGTE